MYIDQDTLLCEILYTTQVLAEATLQLHASGSAPSSVQPGNQVMIQGKPVVITTSIFILLFI